ncbi:MAG TPA: hypothetical protein VFG89_05210 [Coriobacteriia bacterium]|nr:hypothetical protein [Coriobacteriia bacterium]
MVDAKSIGLRSQEYHEGLKDVAIDAFTETSLATTLKVGKAGTLASHLKGLNQVTDIDALTYLAADLGIRSTELPVVLRELQELDFATVVGSTDRPSRLELRIPELRSIYDDLGKRWNDLGPSEMEQGAIDALDRVARFPHEKSQLVDDLGDDDLAEKVLTVGKNAAVLESFHDDERQIVYSPLTIEESPEIVARLYDEGDPALVSKVLEEVRAQQGVPLEALRVSDQDSLLRLVMLGAICPVQICDALNARRTFLFTPRGGLTREQRVVLEKARAILACVRYGQHYAGTRPILYPHRILEVLLEAKKFKTPRPDFRVQYALLIKKQVGFVTPSDRSGFDYFHLIDSEENRHAMRIAIDLLKSGQTTGSRLEVDSSEMLSVPGSYSDALPTRTRMRATAEGIAGVNAEVLDRISLLARGVVS